MIDRKCSRCRAYRHYCVKSSGNVVPVFVSVIIGSFRDTKLMVFLGASHLVMCFLFLTREPTHAPGAGYSRAPQRFSLVKTVVSLWSLLLKTGSLDNAILEFSSAQPSWVMSNYIMLYKYGKRTHELLGRFYFYIILIFYVLGAFLIKQLFHSRLLDMRWLYSTRRDAPRWPSTISYPIRARRIIVK